jgi:hypothetical protein
MLKLGRVARPGGRRSGACRRVVNNIRAKASRRSVRCGPDAGGVDDCGRSRTSWTLLDACAWNGIGGRCALPSFAPTVPPSRRLSTGFSRWCRCSEDIKVAGRIGSRRHRCHSPDGAARIQKVALGRLETSVGASRCPQPLHQFGAARRTTRRRFGAKAALTGSIPALGRVVSRSGCAHARHEGSHATSSSH